MNALSLSPLQIALGTSIAVHGLLLAVRVADPNAFKRVFEDAPLEVTLVNARTTDQPHKAQAIAQAAMAGGGATQSGRATSPLPPALLTQDGEDAEQTMQRQLLYLQEQQSLLLTQVKQQLATLPRQEPKDASAATQPDERELKQRQLLKQFAEIERRIEQGGMGPRKRYVGPSTREEVYALYYDRLRRAIEDKGTENFPQAGGRKLYGELTMIVDVNSQGQVLRTEIAQSSGNPALDRRAAAITRSAAPFGPFNDDMRRQADVIVVISRFRFTREETLETGLASN